MITPSSDLIFLSLLPGGIILIVGLLMKYYPPIYPNMWMGYRTPFSTKNEQTWKEGNSYSANLMIPFGILNIIVWGDLAYLFQDNPKNPFVPLIGIPTLIGSAIALVILTELHLRKIFDKDGNRKAGI